MGVSLFLLLRVVEQGGEIKSYSASTTTRLSKLEQTASTVPGQSGPPLLFLHLYCGSFEQLRGAWITISQVYCVFR